MSITAELNAITTNDFKDGLTVQVYESSPLIVKLQKSNKITSDGGLQIQRQIRYKKLGTGQTTSPRAQVLFTSKETRTNILVDWKYYDANAVIHWDEDIKASGKAALVNLVRDKHVELADELKDKIQSDLWATSTSSGSMTSLLDIVDSANSYGGIDVADTAEWAGGEDSTTTTMRLYGSGSLTYMINAATFGSDGPTMHITTRNLFSKFESLMEGQKIYQDDDLADAGFANVKLHGKPVVSDVYCPAGYWLGLDLDKFELVVHKKDNMNITEWFDLKQGGFPRASAKYASFVGNIVCVMRKTSFKFSALDYTL